MHAVGVGVGRARGVESEPTEHRRVRRRVATGEVRCRGEQTRRRARQEPQLPTEAPTVHAVLSPACAAGLKLSAASTQSGSSDIG
jgi:hypothetical protein